ncbi:hypothetical protein VSH64_23265 [Amycolatopsis rhabdoformis]|uniref:ASCH domain-containing protein n=1 Tax=Amycolatopsis rhabdoformis TaxID=1448059 RepID=A0ABZ1IL90_9PSEU|nr:hypothetical protein [Amycolatopsis rhabdoformis]WSE34959.1 hypothetical protein VSH64_23265 [Amycolatopsis rhabdoformis]
MLFEARLREGIHEGRVTVMVRRWARNKAIPGHRYRTGVDLIEVDEVDEISPGDLTTDDVRAAGFDDVAGVLAGLRGDESAPLYRVRFHVVADGDPRDRLAADAQLSAADVEAISARLTRFDASGEHGPWTHETLVAIQGNPGLRAGTLAEQLGWDELLIFKRSVRKLKDLGLTLSLEVGYRISPRGEAYLRLSGRTR